MATGAGRERDLEAEVGRLRRRLADIERLAHVGSWQWDIVRNDVVWSEGLTRLFGIDPDSTEPSYASFEPFIHPDDRDMVNATVQRAMRTGEGYTFEHRLVRPNGDVRWVHASGEVELDNAGEVVRMHGISVDITERRALDLELRRFVSDAAHELRTPVSTVTYAIGMLVEDDLPADQRKVVLDALARNGKRLARLTESLLDLSTIEADPGTVMLQPVGLAEIVGRAVEAVHPDPLERPAVLVDIPDGLLVRAAADDLERVFVNLLGNAAQHGGSQVSVSASSRDHQVTIRVCDDGPGVEPDLTATLFAPFARGRRAGARGAGLGLSITRQLVTRFGGSIWHDADEDGACFVIRLDTAP